MMEQLIRGKNKKSKEMGKSETNEAESEEAAPAASGGEDSIQAVFSQISTVLSENLVKETNSVFSFNVSDQKSDWFLDLKNGAGSCGKGKPPVEADATLTMTSDNFNKMFAGKLKPTAAFMSGRLKISGNMGKAMKLEKLMGKMQARGYSTNSNMGKQGASLSKL